MIGLANSGADTANCVKQAFEFGLGKGHTLAAFLPFITDIRAIGLTTAQGLTSTTAFYWDRGRKSRAWSRQFFAVRNAMPTMIQAGTTPRYCTTCTPCRMPDQAGPMRDAGARKRPVDDVIFHDGHVVDGQVVHDMYRRG